MNASLLEVIQDRVLLADGAMGTEIYRRGFFVNRCYDHLNITNPEIIGDVLGAYATAGADILTTNTFGANRLGLSTFGLQESLPDVIRRGVEIAKEAAGDNRFVAGSVGPISNVLIEKLDCTENDIRNAQREQIEFLVEAGVDFLLLETYPTWESLNQVYQEARKVSPTIPCVTSLSIAAFGKSRYAEPASEGKGESNDDITPADFASLALSEWGNKPEGLPILGLNCGGGPPEVLECFGELKKALPPDTPAIAMPNSGTPKLIDGRTLDLSSPEYFAEYARRFVSRGARIIGGCCGTNPSMIKEVRSYLRQIQPGRAHIEIKQEAEPELLEAMPLPERSVWGYKIGTKFTVSVELDPPKGLDVGKSVEGAKFLAANGIDAVNIADGPRASGRINPATLAAKVREQAEIETIVHVCCRDRNILGLQMDLMSMHVQGIRNLMLITGDPPKMGLYPDATAVFDMDAIGLIKSTNLLNQGVDLAQRPLGGQTAFVIGCGCNPGMEDLDREIKRYEQKVAAGAEFVFSQPVYDIQLLVNFLERTKHVKPIPFFVGILPLASLRNAEFLTKNVPGMEVPESIQKRLALAPTKETQRKEGIAIAAEALGEAKRHERVRGAYVFPPFGRYESILDVLEKAGCR